jgi:oligogalacturonide lyase
LPTAELQGALMGVSDVLGSEMRTFQDPFTGAAVHQLTDWRAHSHHPYFTNSGLWDGGRTCVLYTSDHNGYGNVFLAEVPAFEDLPPVPQEDAT